VKALACELPSERGLPFSRLSHADIAREARREGIVESISRSTVWRWLSEDAIRPWTHRSWIWSRDPEFSEKAARVLDLYQRRWAGESLGPEDYVISADEKTSIQARKRQHEGKPPAPGRTRRYENEYERKGALAYMAAWDVHRAEAFGLCRQKTGIESFHDLVDLVMSQEPYSSANRVFWIIDNGSSHRGQRSIDRMSKWYSNAHLVHTPVHASWLNQIEIYFSIVDRKVLTPTEFASLEDLETNLIGFQTYYSQIADPFKWKFTAADLDRVLADLPRHREGNQRLAA
jgi:hypothetical protein